MMSLKSLISIALMKLTEVLEVAKQGYDKYEYHMTAHGSS